MSSNAISLQGLRSGSFPTANRPKPALRRVWKPSTCLKIHLALVGGCAAILYLFPPATALIVSGLLVGTPLLILGVVEARRHSLWLNPLSVFLLFLGSELGPAAIYGGVSLLNEGWIKFPLADIPARDVALGYFITLVGTFTMHLGLRAFGPASEARMDQFVDWKPHWVLLLFGVGAFATYRPIALEFLGMFGGALQWASLAVLLGYALSSGALRSHISRLLFTAGVGIDLMAALFSQYSSKESAMLAFLPAIAFMTRRKEYHKWIPVFGALVSVLYLGIIAPAVNKSRVIQQGSSYDKIMTAMKTSSPFYSVDPVVRSMEDQVDGLMFRLFEIPPVTGFMVGEVRRTGLQLGGTMTDLYYAFIPRIIWPQKPIVSRGAWFTTYLGMAPREAEATTSTGMTTFGEWYWNFGVPGVIVGMFLTGALLSGLWRLAGSNPMQHPINMALYVATIIYVVNLADASSPIVSSMALYMLFGGLMFLRKMGRGRAVPPLARNQWLQRRLVRNDVAFAVKNPHPWRHS